MSGFFMLLGVTNIHLWSFTCLHCNQYIKQQYSVHTLNVCSCTLSVIFLVWVRISFNSPFNELTGLWYIYSIPGNIILAPFLLFYRGEQSLASNLQNIGNSSLNPFYFCIQKHGVPAYQSHYVDIGSINNVQCFTRKQNNNVLKGLLPDFFSSGYFIVPLHSSEYIFIWAWVRKFSNLRKNNSDNEQRNVFQNFKANSFVKLFGQNMYKYFWSG